MLFMKALLVFRPYVRFLLARSTSISRLCPGFLATNAKIVNQYVSRTDFGHRNRLNFPDVSEKVAQKSSSLAPNVFQATLKKVRAALTSRRKDKDHAPVETSAMRPHKAKRPPLTYQMILADYGLGQRDILSAWFKMVEQHLREHKDFHGHIAKLLWGVLDTESPEVKAAVAYWVIRVIRMLTVSIVPPLDPSHYM